MRMSTKGRFAVNAMIDLGLREQAGPVALAAIAARQQVSLSYLEQMFSALRSAGLVVSTRGPGGGYTLGRTPQAISLADIVRAVDEPSEPQDDPEKAASGAAMTQSLWASLNEVVLRHMATISLHSLMQDQLAKGVSVQGKPTRRALQVQTPVRPVRTTAPNSVFAFGRSFSAK